MSWRPTEDTGPVISLPTHEPSGANRDRGSRPGANQIRATEGYLMLRRDAKTSLVAFVLLGLLTLSTSLYAAVPALDQGSSPVAAVVDWPHWHGPGGVGPCPPQPMLPPPPPMPLPVTPGLEPFASSWLVLPQSLWGLPDSPQLKCGPINVVDGPQRGYYPAPERSVCGQKYDPSDDIYSPLPVVDPAVQPKGTQLPRELADPLRELARSLIDRLTF